MKLKSISNKIKGNPTMTEGTSIFNTRDMRHFAFS